MSHQEETIPLMSSMSSRPVQPYSTASATTAANSGSNEDSEKDGRFTCNICLDPVTDPVTTVCGHLFCWPCLYRWLETHHTTCPVCLAGVSRENVIPLFIKGSEDDPRVKPAASDIPSRPAAQRPEAPPRTAANGTTNAAPHFGGLSFTAGFGFFPSLFGLQFQSFVDPVPHVPGRARTQAEEEQEIISRMLVGLFVLVIVCLFVF